MQNLKLNANEAVNFLKNNVKIHDNLEISYGRMFADGEVLNMDFSKYFGKPGFKMLISLDNTDLNPTVEIDFDEVKDLLIEFHHFPQNGEETIVQVIWVYYFFQIYFID